MIITGNSSYPPEALNPLPHHTKLHNINDMGQHVMVLHKLGGGVSRFFKFWIVTPTGLITRGYKYGYK